MRQGRRYVPTFPVFDTWSLMATGVDLAMISGGSAVSTAWPSANRALACPFAIAEPLAIVKLLTENGATASGNIDIGIYDENWGRLVSMGSTAQSGAPALQAFDIADVNLPGASRYYLAMAADATTTTILARTMTNALHLKAAGWAQMDSAFPLPATFVPAAFSTAAAFVFGASSRVVL